LVELQDVFYAGRHSSCSGRINFLDYIDQFCEHRKQAYRGLSQGLKKHLMLYKGSFIPISDINPSFLGGFHRYLDQAQSQSHTSRNKPCFLSQGTKWNYFNILSLLLNKACREGYIPRNPMHTLRAEERPRRAEPRKTYLVLQEVRKLADTPLREHPEVKQLPDASYTGKILKKWIQTAGIQKKVTFHVSRHTFATLSLTYGAELYTISKLLGHSNIKVTQIYADIINEKKREAVESIPSIGG
jgi:integrase